MYMDVLSGELILAGPTRLELATSGVTGRRSNQAELRPRQRGGWKNIRFFPFFCQE